MTTGKITELNEWLVPFFFNGGDMCLRRWDDRHYKYMRGDEQFGGLVRSDDPQFHEHLTEAQSIGRSRVAQKRLERMRSRKSHEAGA